jgi:hypothetical protein
MKGLPGPRQGEPGRSARLARRGGCIYRARTMNERGRTLRRGHQRQIGVTACLPAAQLSRPSFRISNLKSRASAPTSTRQYFQVEIALSHSKQGVGAPATRQFFEGSPLPIFKFPISNLESFPEFPASGLQPLATTNRVSMLAECFSPYPVQNKQSAHETGVNFLRWYFCPLSHRRLCRAEVPGATFNSPETSLQRRGGYEGHVLDSAARIGLLNR